jgi:hypothetical protein
LGGYSVVDVQVVLVDGEAHAKDSSSAAFEIAGSLAFERACREGLVLLEPYATIEVTAPGAHGGEVIGDLGARRGHRRGRRRAWKLADRFSTGSARRDVRLRSEPARLHARTRQRSRSGPTSTGRRPYTWCAAWSGSGWGNPARQTEAEPGGPFSRAPRANREHVIVRPARREFASRSRIPKSLPLLLL